MPVKLKDKESVIFNLQGEEIEVYFRKPNASEMVRFLGSTLSGRGPEAMEQMLISSMELGFSCILGIREGDIVLIEDGDSKSLITDPEKPACDKNWKEILKEKMPELFLMLGNHLVRSTRAELEVREKN